MESSSSSTHVLRLMFEYEGNTVQLKATQKVVMTLPPATSFIPEVKQSGFWYELRDANNHTLYHRAIGSPIRFDAEVFSNEDRESVARHEVTTPSGAFVLLVPDTPEADSIVLFSSSVQPRAAAQPATELIRFKLSKS